MNKSNYIYISWFFDKPVEWGFTDNFVEWTSNIKTIAYFLFQCNDVSGAKIRLFKQVEQNQNTDIKLIVLNFIKSEK